MSGPPPWSWRADGGYFPPTGGAPTPPGPPPPPGFFYGPPNQMFFGSVPPPGGIFYYPPASISMPPFPAPAPLPPPPPPTFSEPPPPYFAHHPPHPFFIPPPPMPAQAPPPPPPQRPTTLGTGGDSGMRPSGISYFYPAKHTQIHVLPRNAKPWDQGWMRQQGGNGDFEFSIRRVPTGISVRELIEGLTGEGKAEEWGVVECAERGGGRWGKGLSIKYKDERAKKTLDAIGWTEKRGTSQAPVWVVVHKI